MINYISVFYIGPNRDYRRYQEVYQVDPLYFVKKQRDFLSYCDEKDISKVTFVFNDDISVELKSKILDVKIDGGRIPLEIIFRPNLGFSYGAWSDAIIKNINDFEYFFIIEDDMLPTREKWYEYMIDNMTYEKPIMCAYKEVKDGTPFASAPHSLIRGQNCRHLLSKYGQIFLYNTENTYPSAWDSQLKYYNLFLNEGWELLDTLKDFSYTHNLNCHINNVKVFGDAYLPSLFVPIML